MFHSLYQPLLAAILMSVLAAHDGKKLPTAFTKMALEAFGK